MNADIGRNIARIRKEREIGRARLALVVKMDEGYLERIEQGTMQPQVSELMRLATALNTDIAALIYGKEFSQKKAIATTPEQRLTVQRARYLSYESLAPYYGGRHMEPFIVELNAQHSRPGDSSRHQGEEFHFVLEGTLRTIVEQQEHVLEPGDSLYFDASLPHAVAALSSSAKFVAVIYNGETMLQLTRGKRMRDLIQAAKMARGKNVAVVCPDRTTLEAIRLGVEEGVIATAYLFGNSEQLAEAQLRSDSYRIAPRAKDGEDTEEAACFAALAAIRGGECQMLMKGKINTATFAKAILDRKRGIGTDRRLSLVSIFELPDVDRLIFLTDAGINPELRPDNDLEASLDIVQNAIDVAHSFGVVVPKVALMDANEVPSASIPSTLYEQQLAGMDWKDAVVYGPISYDLALYEEAAERKKVARTPVTGQADVLVVPYIVAGNVLYKAWTMTMAAEVANVVAGAQAPVILTSRSDSNLVKFLSLCACVVYGQYLQQGNPRP